MKEYINCFINDNGDLTIWGILMCIFGIPVAIPFYLIWLVFFYKVN